MMLVALLVLADVLAAVPDPPPPPILAAEEREALLGGRTIWRHERGPDGEGGMAAALVAAPPEVVWRHILDYDAYVTFLPYVTASSTDGIQTQDDHTVIDCTMELTTRGIVTRYAVRNHHYPDRGYLLFAMASGALNPLKEASGYWQVLPWAEEPSRTLLVYRVQIHTAWFVPGWARRRAAQTGLPTVARQIAERAAAEAAAREEPR